MTKLGRYKINVYSWQWYHAKPYTAEGNLTYLSLTRPFNSHAPKCRTLLEASRYRQWLVLAFTGQLSHVKILRAR